MEPLSISRDGRVVSGPGRRQAWSLKFCASCRGGPWDTLRPQHVAKTPFAAITLWLLGSADRGMAANGDAAMSAPPAELCCPLSGQLMTDPVILVDTGDTYNRRSIEDWHVTPPLLTHIPVVANPRSAPHQARCFARP